LERLRTSGRLAQFRYLHFATHGESNDARSFESALILAYDDISAAAPLAGGKSYDGRLTANEVLDNWQLNADLVTLSACESALGRPGGGDGLLGFAQAFLLAGARSVCLSLWKVDDTATALLMERFYQNLFGKREGLSQPMPKAEALAEAKNWLRNLTRDEATKLAAAMTSGVARGKGEPALKLVVPAASNDEVAKDDCPFAHPRYWAAFILIGDPN
jgi:CHAT domain-containing protein